MGPFQKLSFVANKRAPLVQGAGSHEPMKQDIYWLNLNIGGKLFIGCWYKKLAKFIEVNLKLFEASPKIVIIRNEVFSVY